MPPFGVHGYERKEVTEDPEIRLHEQRAEINSYRATTLSKQRYSSFKGNWKVVGDKGLDTPKAYYEVEGLSYGFRMAAWINQHNGTVTDLFTQVEERELSGAWKPLNNIEPTFRARIAVHGIEYQDIDINALTPEAHRQLAADLDETVALVLAATQAETGMSAERII